MDVPVTVNTEWSGPNGFSSIQINLSAVSGLNSYESTALVTSFSRSYSGNYTCRALIHPEHSALIQTASVLVTLSVTVGTCAISVDYTFHNNIEGLREPLQSYQSDLSNQK